MELSPATVSLLTELETFSGGTITRRPDLGLLLECGRSGPDREVLDEIGFFSKFLHRTFGIMTRIGPGGEGYERLAREFSGAVEKTRALMTSLIAQSPGDEREGFTAAYLAMTQESLDNLLALCRDLSWYKNWLIDSHRQRKAGR